MTLTINGRGVATYTTTSGTVTESGMTYTGTFYTLTAEPEHYPRWWCGSASNVAWRITYEQYESWWEHDSSGERTVYHETEKETHTATVYGNPCEWSCTSSSSDRLLLMTGTAEGLQTAIEYVVHLTLLSAEITFTFYGTDKLLYDNSANATEKIVRRGDVIVYGRDATVT